MAIAHAHLAPWTPWSNLAVRVNRATDDRPGIQQEAICYQWFKQQLTDHRSQAACTAMLSTAPPRQALLTSRQQIFMVSQKKWTISFYCLQCVYHTHTKNFYNIFTVHKTLIIMLFSMSTLHCNKCKPVVSKT